MNDQQKLKIREEINTLLEDCVECTNPEYGDMGIPSHRIERITDKVLSLFLSKIDELLKEQINHIDEIVNFKLVCDDSFIEFIQPYVNKKLKEQREGLMEKIGELRHEIQQSEMPLGNEQWKEGHTKCLNEVLSLIKEDK